MGIDGSVSDGPRLDAPVPHKIAFVTSQVFTGNLGGLVGADVKCQTAASSAGLPGVYKAWLSNATVSAASRLEHATLPYMLVDGTVVATDWTMLTSGRLMHAIDLTERGTPAVAGSNQDCFFGGTGKFVWTNSSANGTVANGGMVSSCGNDWNSSGPTDASGPFGVVGSMSHADVMWTLSCGSARCENTAPLYCLEQ